MPGGAALWCWPGAPAVAQPHERIVGGDAVDPGAERRLPAEVLEVLVGGEEGVLGDLRRVRLGPGHPEGEAVDLVLLALHQGLEGGDVALLGALEQLVRVENGEAVAVIFSVRIGPAPL